MDPFLAEIRMVSFNFAPAGWALCNGQILQITQNQALYTLIGVTFGGDGKTTFALPDLRGRTPMVVDNTAIKLGEMTGTANKTLTVNQLPLHTHQLNASTLPGTLGAGSPSNNIFGSTGQGDNDYATYPQQPVSPVLTAMSPQVIAMAGGSGPIPNMMPYLAVNFLIAVQGIYPPRP